MQWQVQLFIREHHNGFFSIDVIGEPGLHVYTERLETAREELELLLSDRLERLHPRNAGRYAVADSLALIEVDLPDALVIDDLEGQLRYPTKVSVLCARRRKWLQLWMPRWQLHYWIASDREPEEAVVEFLTEHLKKLSDHQRLMLRWEGKEWLETLTVDAERPPLSAFTGKFLGVDMLPEPTAKDADADDDDTDDDEDADADADADAGDDSARAQQQAGDKKRQKKKKKKKRPPTPTLKRIGVPMSQLARDEELTRAFGREREVGELLAMLGAPGATAFVVLGESGVGKTAILEELVHRIRERNAPRTLRNRPVWFANASRLIAGDGWFGDWQRQCLDVIQECIDAEVIWYIGDVLALLDAGKSLGSDQNVALLLRPFLAGKRITLVAECTPEKWAQLEQRDAGFARVFATYRLEEPSPEQTRHILKAVAGDLEETTGAHIDTDGLRAVEELCARYGSDNSLLGASIHFLRRLIDTQVGEHEDRQRRAGADIDDATPAPITRSTVVDRFCAESGMPAFLVRDDLPMDPQAVHQHFRHRLIGQTEAVRRMTDLVAMVKAGLSDTGRPLGSFLFVGPTGVGKTEMAKALTEFLFSRKDRLVRFDMSEFVSPDSVHRFIGSDGQEGQLISAIRRAPFCVLLLDEIEKAHPAVFDVLLQVLGEARLTDHAGRTADFRNTVVLMTSNLGVDTFKVRAGFQTSAARSFREHFEAEAQKFFRPEFLNRIDYMVPFAPLERDAIEQITEREIHKFLAREGIKQRGLDVTLPTPVRDWLAKHGVAPKYGARPLKRLIERALTTPLAKHLSEHDSPAVAVTREDDQLRFAGKDRGRRPVAVALNKVVRFLERARLVRYQLQQWLRSEPYRDLVHAIRLIDRLSQDRNFWKDPVWAEKRMRSAEKPRALRQAFDELYEHISSIEDLAFEIHHDRNPEPLELLQQDFETCMGKLDDLELDLFGQRFESSERATLFLQPSSDGSQLLADLIAVYGMLAGERSWTIKAWYAHEDRAVVMEREQRRAQLASATDRRKKDRGRREKTSDERAAWSWKRCDATLAPPGEDEDDAVYRRRVERFARDVASSHDTAIRALRIEGPHVCSLLSAEGGVHMSITSDGSPQVKVQFADLAARQLPNPLDAQQTFSSQRCRILYDNRRIVQDPVLAINYPLEPRLHRPYQRFMRAHIYHQLFGPGAHRVFKR